MQTRPTTGSRYVGGPQPSSLADVLERVLDRGVVIAGDIVISVVNVELLTLKIRLIIASVDTAKEIGLDWWTRDPFLNSHAHDHELEAENRRLRARLDALESKALESQGLESKQDAQENQPAGGRP